MANKNLTAAKSAKNDEFYTRLQDIERECFHYKDYFRGKVIYCNCDDPRESNFFRYFVLNFEFFGLKRLIATGYKRGGRGVKYVYEGDVTGNPVIDNKEIVVTEMEGDGDFRSQECVELLMRADVVVTNPPFSLFREFVAQLMEYGKQFLIIGNMNAVNYKEIFPLIKNDQLWLGLNTVKEFAIPNNGVQNAKTQYKHNGVVYQKFGNITWFTNIVNTKRDTPLILCKWYEKESGLYPKYDNYDAIEVGKVSDIPADYRGVMGVPITFLDKYCPGQFEIIGITKTWLHIASKTYPEQIQNNPDGTSVKVTKLNDGPVLPITQPLINEVYYTVNNCLYKQLYTRLLIRHRHPINYTDYFNQLKNNEL